MGIFLFIIAATIVVLTSIFILSIFDYFSWIERVIIFLLACSANIILAVFILSFLKWISPLGFLIIHAIFLLLSFLIIKLTNRKFFSPFPKIDLGEFKKHPPILILGAAVLAFLVVSIFLILLVPPNNWDSMTYRLSRIGFWLQNSSLEFFKTYDVRQNSYSTNAQILMMWCIAFIKSDIFAGFVQWVGYLGTILLVYGIALELGASRNQSIFAGLVWASIPEVMLEATSTQYDIAVTFFLMAYIFFLLRGIREMGWRGILISGISLGLAIGTKATAFFALPGIFIGTLFIFYKVKNNFWKNLTLWITFTSFGIIIFGSYVYIQNYLYYGTIFGSESLIKEVTNVSDLNHRVSMFYNLFHTWYRFLDTSGIPYITIPGFFQTPFQEDFAGYGLIWLLLGVPAFFYSFYRGFFKNDFLRGGIFIIAVGYILVFSYVVHNDPFIFRLLIPFTAMVCPLVASFYPQEDKRNKKQKIYKGVIIAIAVIGAIQVFISTVANPSKPLVSKPSILFSPLYFRYMGKSLFDMDFYEKRFMVHDRFKAPEMLIFRELDKFAKSGSRVGIIGSTDTWDYPAFGRRFERIVIPIVVKDEEPDADVFIKYNLDYLIAYAPIQASPGFRTDMMPFLEQLAKQRGSILRISRADNIFLFMRNE